LTPNGRLEKRTYAVQQIPAYSITWSAIATSGLRMSTARARDGREAPVDLDENIDFRADGIANRTCDLHGAPYVILRDVSPPGAGNGIEFQRSESALEHCFAALQIADAGFSLLASGIRPLRSNTSVASLGSPLVFRTASIFRRLKPDIPSSDFSHSLPFPTSFPSFDESH
jgi:hypothetical protein